MVPSLKVTPVRLDRAARADFTTCVWVGKTLKARRRRREFLATPPWVDRKALRRLNRIARVMRLHGKDVQVDHIVPIGGRTVSGLNVPWNMQIIPRLENETKHRVWDPI